jgi:hypothetical protein
MGRKNALEVIQHDNVDDAALDKSMASLVNVSGNSALVSEMMDYDLAYNRDRVVQEARFYMSASAEAMLEAGKRLILLKENEPHGDFIEIVEEKLGMAARTARLMMQAAVRYMSPALGSNRQALAVLGKTKMFELMVLGDDEIAELAEGGTIAGMKLDDIERMTSRELKAAIRDLRQDSVAKDSILAAKSKKIDSLETALQRKKSETPAEEWTWAPSRRALLDSCESLSNFAQSELRRALVDIQAQAEIEGSLPEDIEALQGLALSSVMQTLVELQKDFRLNIDLEAIVVPPWMAEFKSSDKNS